MENYITLTIQKIELIIFLINLDYLIFYNLQEAIDPGALLRMQQAVKKSSGQDFNIKPSDIIPRGGGIPSF